MSARAAAAADGAGRDWHDLQVANPSFLVEKLGAECSDTQGLRELTVNAHGGDRRGSARERPGAWSGISTGNAPTHRGDGSRKLSITDTGIGMSPEAMRYYINHLAATSHEQGRTKNYGVGAKVAAGSRNPHGLEYRSWHQGRGALVCFKRHPSGRWGLEPQQWPDGRRDFWRPLTQSEKPWALRGRPHGTQVVLLGQHERDDTTQAPKSVTEGRQRWVARYLNTRFLRLPDQLELLVRATPRKRVA